MNIEINNTELFRQLLIVSSEGQRLGSYNPPLTGWNDNELKNLASTFPKEWECCEIEIMFI